MGYGWTLHRRVEIVSDLIRVDLRMAILTYTWTGIGDDGEPANALSGGWHSQAMPLFCCQGSFQMFPTPFTSYFHPCLKSSSSLFFVFYPWWHFVCSWGSLQTGSLTPDCSSVPPFSKPTRCKAAEDVAADARIIAPLTYFCRLFWWSVAAVHAGYLICIFAKSLADGTRAWLDNGGLIPTQLTQTHMQSFSASYTIPSPFLWQMNGGHVCPLKVDPLELDEKPWHHIRSAWALAHFENGKTFVAGFKGITNKIYSPSYLVRGRDVFWEEMKGDSAWV